MFWGLIMEPGRCYTQKVRIPFHVSMAALDISNSSDEPAQVMCVFDNRNYLICTLDKKDRLQCSLDLNFAANTKVSFATNGSSHIHLTGYLNTMDEIDDDEDIIEEEVEDNSLSGLRMSTKKRMLALADENPPSKRSKRDRAAVTTTLINGNDDEDDSSDDSDFVFEEEIGDLIEEDSDDDMDEDDDDDEDGEEEEEEDDDDEDDEELSDLSDEEEETMAVSPSKQNGVSKKSPTKQQQQQKKKDDKTPKKQEQDKKQKTPKSEKKKAGSPEKTPKQAEQKSPKQQNEPKSPKPKKTTLKGGVIVEDIKEGNGDLTKQAPNKSKLEQMREYNLVRRKSSDLSEDSFFDQYDSETSIQTVGKSDKYAEEIVQEANEDEISEKIPMLKDSGNLADWGKIVSISYKTKILKGDTVLDSKAKESANFRLGKGMQGFDTCIIGMKVGEKRRIKISTELANRFKGQPLPSFCLNYTLDFVVRLKNVRYV